MVVVVVAVVVALVVDWEVVRASGSGRKLGKKLEEKGSEILTERRIEVIQGVWELLTLGVSKCANNCK